MSGLFADSESKAQISACGRFRFRLRRVWDEQLPRCLWVTLNPSTADAKVDDPTVRKCIGFARRWGYGSIEIVNIYPFRSPSPKACFAFMDELAESDKDLSEAVRAMNFLAWAHAKQLCTHYMAAWGASQIETNADAVINLFGDLDCLKLSNVGNPHHPLYVPYETVPIPFARQGSVKGEVVHY
jgi:hypothetical protein